MRQLFDIFEKDIYSEHFTRKEYIIYGVIVPLAFMAVAVLAGAVE